MRLRVLLAALALLPSLAAAEGFFTLEGHGGPVRGIGASSAGGTILTASFDYSVGVWQQGEPRWLEGHRAAVNAAEFAGDGIVVSAGDDFDVVKWNLESGESEVLGSHTGKILSLAVSPDGAVVASAGWDRKIGIWPLDGSAPRFIEGHGGGVNDILFSSDGALIYSASGDGTIRVWRVEDGIQTRVLVRHGFGINTLAADFKAGWLAYGAVDGGTRVLDIDSGDLIADFTLDRRPILAMAVDAAGERLAVGDGHGYIMIVDCAAWEIWKDFRAALHGPVWALRFSADGANIYAGGIDDSMFAWPVASLDEHGRMAAGRPSYLRKPGEMSNGERQFQRKCSICHTLVPDSMRRAGPTLSGIFGRRAGDLPGYRYSPALQTSRIVWSEETIDLLFDLGPDEYIPGTKMPMQRIADPQDRVDLITYLKSALAEVE